MSGVFATLLCVGVQLILTSGVQEPLPQPHIQAVPDSLILKGEPVTIQCSGPTIAENYLISKKEVFEDGEKTQMVNSRTLAISQMTPQDVGLYTCSYQRGHIWSPPSQPLPLVMTGAYVKPSVLAVPGPVLSPGQSLRLDCVSSVKFENYSFTLESRVYTSQPANLAQGGKGSQASCHVDLGIPTQKGPYRCFGYFQNAPYWWSHPSDPLWLQVKDAPFTAPSTQPAWTTESSDPLLHFEYTTHSADPHNRPTFKGSEPVTDSLGHPGTTESRATTDSSEHTTITEPDVTAVSSDANTGTLHTQIPGASPDPSVEPPNFLEQYWGVLIGVLTAFVLLLIFFLVLRHHRAGNNTQRQDGAEYQLPDAKNLGEVTYSQVTCTVTAATKPTLQPEGKATSEYATLALR